MASDLAASFLREHEQDDAMQILDGIESDEDARDSLFPMGSISHNSNSIGLEKTHSTSSLQTTSHHQLFEQSENVVQDDPWAAQFTDQAPEWDWNEQKETEVAPLSSSAATATAATTSDAPMTSSDGGFLSFLNDANMPQESSSSMPTSTPKGGYSSPRVAKRHRWSDKEVQALMAGVAAHGSGNWGAILSDPKFSPVLGSRQKASLNRKWNRLRSVGQSMVSTPTEAETPVSVPDIKDMKDAPELPQASPNSWREFRGDNMLQAVDSPCPVSPTDSSGGDTTSQRWTETEVDALQRAMIEHHGNWDSILQDPEFAVLRKRRKPALQSKWFRIRKTPPSSAVTPETLPPSVSQSQSQNPTMTSSTPPVSSSQTDTSSYPSKMRHVSMTEMSRLQDAVNVHGEGRWKQIIEDPRFSTTLNKFQPEELACIWRRMGEVRARAALAAADAARKKAATAPVNSSTAMLLAQMQQAATIHGDDGWERVRADPRFRHTLARFSVQQLSKQWQRMTAQHSSGYARPSCVVSPEELSALQKAVCVHGEAWARILQDPMFAPSLVRYQPAQLEQIWLKFRAHQAQQVRGRGAMTPEMVQVVRSKSGASAFTPEEIAKLHMAVYMYGDGAWEAILNDKIYGPVFRANRRSCEDLERLWNWISESLQHSQSQHQPQSQHQQSQSHHSQSQSQHQQSHLPSSQSQHHQQQQQHQQPPQHQHSQHQHNPLPSPPHNGRNTLPSPVSVKTESESFEIQMLRQGVSVYGEGRWFEIKNDPRFSSVLCKYDVDVLKATWRAYLKSLQQRGVAVPVAGEPCSFEELQTLRRAVAMYGDQNWKSILADPRFAPTFASRTPDWLAQAWVYACKQDAASVPEPALALTPNASVTRSSSPAPSLLIPPQEPQQQQTQPQKQKQQPKESVESAKGSPGSSSSNRSVRSDEKEDAMEDMEKLNPPPRRGRSASMSKRWTQEEVSVLRNAVQHHGEGNWKEMLNDEKFNEHFSNRGVQSLQRKWQRLHRVKSTDSKNSKKHKPGPKQTSTSNSNALKSASGGSPAADAYSSLPPWGEHVAPAWSQGQQWLSGAEVSELCLLAAQAPSHGRSLALALLQNPSTDASEIVASLDKCSSSSAQVDSALLRCALGMESSSPFFPPEDDDDDDDDDSDALSLVSVATVRLMDGRCESAVELCDRALALEPSCLPALVCRAQARLALAPRNLNVADALADVAKSLAVDGACEPSHVLLQDIVQAIRRPDSTEVNV